MTFGTKGSQANLRRSMLARTGTGHRSCSGRRDALLSSTTPTIHPGTRGDEDEGGACRGLDDHRSGSCRRGRAARRTRSRTVATHRRGHRCRAMPPGAAATATWVPWLQRPSRRLSELFVARQPGRWPMPVVLGRPQGVEQASGAKVVDLLKPLDGSGPVVVIENRRSNCARNHGVHTLEAGMATPRTRWRSAGLPPFYIGNTSNPSRGHLHT